MASITHNGFTYDVNQQGSVVITGPGLPPKGYSLGYIDALGPDAFFAVQAKVSARATFDALSVEADASLDIRSELKSAMQAPASLASGSDPTVAAATVGGAAVVSSANTTVVTTNASSTETNATVSPLVDAGTVATPPAISADGGVVSNAAATQIVAGQQTVAPPGGQSLTQITDTPPVAEPAPVTGTAAVVQTQVPQAQLAGVQVDSVATEAPPVAKSQLTVNTDTSSNAAASSSSTATDNTTNTTSSNTTTGVTGNTPAGAAATSSAAQRQLPDWRAKLSLATKADYLYMAANPGILAPLKETGGVIFPYTPQVQVAYAAHYENTALTHSNYKIFQYGSSSVDSISLTCDFTAQDTAEANYLLAVIHFFKSVTKMFYGQDAAPRNGTPPPLCYLTGFGAFQFDSHPLAITSFNYSLPVDVDYIRASGAAALNYTGLSSAAASDTTMSAAIRAANSGLKPGAVTAAPKWSMYPLDAAPTYVPTKMQIQVSAIPIVTRNDISNDFSLEKYASGILVQGAVRSGRGGIW